MKVDAMQPGFPSVVLAAALVACFPLRAAAADPVIPGAGTILRQIEPVAPPVPSSTGTGLTIEPESVGSMPASAPFPVKVIEISGNTRFDAPTLHALVADAEGKDLDLARLYELAGRITDYYRSHGYPLARAIIPPQTIESGIVRIEVIEARYGRVNLDNRSRVNDSLLNATLSPLHDGQPIEQTGLDHSLLLLSDIPGVVVNATLKPGESVGTSDLVVDTTAGPAVSGNVTLDNYGDRYTGRARIGATANLINPLHHGDVLSASGLTAGEGLIYGRLAYESLLNGLGARMGASYSALRYELGGPLESLDAHGTAQVASAWAKHPFVRSRDFNLYGQLQYDHLALKDRIDTSSIRTDRHLDNGTASLFGDLRDAFLSPASSTLNLSWTSGHVGFDDNAARSADAATAGTGGSFSRWNANLYRLQSLNAKNTIYLALSGQWADGNLDASQKMIAGGPYSVRAYDTGAISADTGYLETIELRHDLGTLWAGQWQAVAFFDSAQVTVNKTTSATGANTAHLSGAGLGLNWAGPNLWSARAYVAAPIGSTPDLVADTSSARAWAEISKAF
jgi:hemolysin activation/secretion protein